MPASGSSVSSAAAPAGRRFSTSWPSPPTPEVGLSILAEVVREIRVGGLAGPALDAVTAAAPTTAIDPVCGMTVTIGPDTVVNPFSFIGRDANIGPECIIGPYAVVPRESIVPGGTTVIRNVSEQPGM